MLKHRRKKLRRVVTAQPEPFTHGLLGDRASENAWLAKEDSNLEMQPSTNRLKFRVNLATRDVPRKPDPKSSRVPPSLITALLPPTKAKSITSFATGRPGIMKAVLKNVVATEFVWTSAAKDALLVWRHA
jgi:hypothetical protein